MCLCSGYIMYKLYNQENLPIPVPSKETGNKEEDQKPPLKVSDTLKHDLIN